ncbi:hypothetical protein HFN65_31225 [Rhizobium laguerreae]|uniref:hypothetical protein n=1 Tax=Rhizobium laguerreae TaxID=1076926 RepID=UPI001C8FEAF6|nr:hypothetical protein [Rhizobium laguerreae]MBY3575411.1 hypothetical protein [Rhizobium laguerreae]
MTSTTIELAPVCKALDDIASAMERALAGITTLRALLSPEEQKQETEFNPKDPRNKYEIGGLMKLTERGIEICYRLFDAGKTRYAVKELMDISFGASDHRFKAWEKAGGINREKMPLD